MLDDKDFNFDSRLSRLETIVEAVSGAVLKIEEKLDGNSKINWAPIAIGVTVLFTVGGSISTIYNARISTINTAVEQLANKSGEAEKTDVEHALTLQAHEDRLERLEIGRKEIIEKLEEIKEGS